MGKHSEIEALKKEKRRFEKKEQLDQVSQHCSILGEEYAKLGLYDEAIEQHQEELLLCESLADQLGAAFANRKLGECHAEKGEFEKAFVYEQRYLNIAQIEGSDVEEQRAYATLGRTYFMQLDSLGSDIQIKKSCKKAESAYLSSLEVCERLKSETKEQEYMQMKARLLLNLGLVYDSTNDLDRCARYLKEAIKITEKFDFTDDRYRCHITLAGIYQRNSSFEKAIQLLDVALQCAEKTKEKKDQVEVHSQKALIYLQNDDITMCKKNFKKAYKIRTGNSEQREKIISCLKSVVRLGGYYTKLTDSTLGPAEKMKIYEKAGDAISNLGAYDQALLHYKKMLSCAQSLNLPERDLIPAYVSLAQTYQDMKEYKNAIEMYEKEMECRDDDYTQIAKSWLNVADCYDKIDAGYEKSVDVYSKALNFAKKSQSRKLQKQILQDVALVHKHYGHTEEYKTTLERLAKYGEVGLDGDEDEDEFSQQTGGDEESEVDLQDLSSSEEEVDEEFAAPRVGVARKSGYKVKRNEKGETELHTASIQGYIKRVHSLVDRGHPVNERDCAGWLPIHEACNHGWPSIVEFLISKGANVNDRGGTHCDGTTPLVDVCGVACAKVDCKKAAEAATYVQRHLDIIHLLVKAGANVHAKDIEGNTAYDCLLEQKHRNSEDLTWEEIAYAKSTLKYLKAVMEGNNPHMQLDSLAADSSSDSDVDLLDEEEDSLPTITSKKDRKRNQKEVENCHHEDSDSDIENHIHASEDIALLKDHPEAAPLAYRNTMNEIGRSAAHNSHLPKAKKKIKVQTRALLTSEQYVGDSWLEDDIGKVSNKRKRNDPCGVLTTTGTRKKSRISDEGAVKTPNRNQRIRVPSENSNDSTDSDSASSEDGDRAPIQAEEVVGTKSNSLIQTTRVPSSPVCVDNAVPSTSTSVSNPTDDANNVRITNIHTSNITSHLVNELFEDFDDALGGLSNTVTAFPMLSSLPTSIPSTLKSNKTKPKKSHQLKITHFGDSINRINHSGSGMPSPSQVNTNMASVVTHNTQQSNNNATGLRQLSQPSPLAGGLNLNGLLMRLRVTVKDRQILVPVPNRTEPVTIAWVAQEASKRYYQLCNLRPVLSLTTKDGALFSPDDFVGELCMNNDQLDSIIERWDLPPINNRYVDACKNLKTVVYTNIKNLLHICSTSNKLDLKNLALRPSQFQPVARSLQCQCALRELDLTGNKFGDDGVKELVKVLPTLSSLSVLNLSSNCITCNGLKALADGLENLHGNSDKPLQALEKISLGYNSFGDSCALTVSKLISSLPALVTLNMTACDFTMHFFQQHRISLGNAFKGSGIQEIDFSHNMMGNTGIELLLKCLRPETVCKINLAGTVTTPMVNGITKYVEQYLNQESCLLQELNLSGCQIISDCIPDLIRCLEVNATLQSLSLSNNKKLCTADLTQVLHASAINTNSRLQSFNFVGCNITSPLPTDFLDVVNDKLHHNVPLRCLKLSVVGLNKVAVDTLVNELWKGKWTAEFAVCDIKGCVINLGVREDC